MKAAFAAGRLRHIQRWSAERTQSALRELRRSSRAAKREIQSLILEKCCRPSKRKSPPRSCPFKMQQEKAVAQHGMSPYEGHAAASLAVGLNYRKPRSPSSNNGEWKID